MTGSTERLVVALREAKAPAGLITRAERNEFNDYKSDSATPCMDLVYALGTAGLTDLRQRAIDGEFDATKEESDEWWEKEGREIARDAGLPADLFER